MKQSLKKQSSLSFLQPLGQLLWQYRIILVVILFGALYAYTLSLSSSLSAVKPSQSSVDDKIQTTVRPKIDESVVQTMLNLEDQNLDIKAIFEEARENPFTE